MNKIAGVWVKAETKTSEHFEKVCCRFGDYFFTGYFDSIKNVYRNGDTDHEYYVDQVEWLDESVQQPPLPQSDFIKAIWDFVRAQGRMLDKWSDGDTKVKNSLWKELHKSGDKVRELLENSRQYSLLNEQPPLPVNDYWQKRCEAAEKLIDKEASPRYKPVAFNAWQQLKSNPAPVPVQQELQEKYEVIVEKFVESLKYGHYIRKAIEGLLKEPHGCRFCDSGVLRTPNNPAKDHDEDCPYLIATNLLKVALPVQQEEKY